MIGGDHGVVSCQESLVEGLDGAEGDERKRKARIVAGDLELGVETADRAAGSKRHFDVGQATCGNVRRTADAEFVGVRAGDVERSQGQRLSCPEVLDLEHLGDSDVGHTEIQRLGYRDLRVADQS
jgi:hypothetical protein